jgi:hypothetical protein
MIKPFTILSVRDEPTGGKSVFYRVRKTVQLTDTKSKTETLETSTHVDDDQDIDEHLFNILKDSGWLDA